MTFNWESGEEVETLGMSGRGMRSISSLRRRSYFASSFVHTFPLLTDPTSLTTSADTTPHFSIISRSL